jgi:hypothetical protein
MPFPFVHDGGDQLRGDGAADEGDQADARDLDEVEDDVAAGRLDVVGGVPLDEGADDPQVGGADVLDIAVALVFEGPEQQGRHDEHEQGQRRELPEAVVDAPDRALLLGGRARPLVRHARPHLARRRGRRS